MGKRLTNVVFEGQLYGNPLGQHRVMLINRAPTQGVLISYSEGGRPKNEHEVELRRQMEECLEEPGGFFLFDPITHYTGKSDAPNVAVRSYLRYESILI